MASPSSSREAETSRFPSLGPAFVARLGQVLLVLAAAPLAAQDAKGAQDAAAVAAKADAEASQAEPAPEPLPEPAPIPRSLEDLIPPEAVANPDGWAAAGVANPDPVLREPDPDQTVPDDGLTDFLPPPNPAMEAALDAAFAEFALDVPAPLPVDPALETQASLTVPVVEDFSQLEEVRIDNTLVLALPAMASAFPERDEFINRFRNLSRLAALDGEADPAPQIAARARADEALLGDILRTYGYYDAMVLRQLSGGRRSRENGADESDDIAADPSVRFDILPGPRYRFGAVELGGLPGLAEPDASRLIAAFGITPDDPLYADRVIDREIELQVALGESGYPFADLGEPDLSIDHARREGDLTLPVEPGGKYAFGTVVSSDPAFLSNRHLQRIARFDAGDIFQQSLETDLRRAIIATGLVSSVTITPRETRAPEGGAPGEVALDVTFERAPLRTIAGAIGYGTEDGFKVEGRWEHRNLFPPEGALRLRGIIGTREALASIGVRRNNFRGRDQVLNVDLYASDITTEAVDARGFGLRGTFEKVSNILFQKPLSWQMGGELLYSDERNRLARNSTIALPRQTYLIGGLFGSVTLDGSDDLLDPSSGYRTTFFLAPEASRSEGEDSFYLRAQADASYYRQVHSTVIAARLRLASIQGADRAEIAPSRRLYSGGGGSVRGYGFQGVGPRNDRGEAVGGGSLVEFSLEARIETGLLGGAIEVVPFMDAGTVGLGSTPDFRFVQVGAGVGIRYKTTFGPIRVDVATPLNPTQFDSPVVVYVGLGQAF